jgi:hypothetical protein
MSALTNVWRQLVQRRLWPVAILLIAALAAVPMVLAQEPDPTAAPAPAVTADASGETALTTQPIVAHATAADRGKRRKVLGSPKNPFGVPRSERSGSEAAPNSSGATTAREPAPVQTESKDEDTSSGSSGGGSPSTGGGGSAPAPTAPAAPTPAPAPAPRTYAMHELTVRFGDASGSPQRQSLKRLQPLPSAEEPVLIYLGVLKDGETAVFLVDHGVQPIGDGDCRPAPEQCETIRLRAGETEFLDVTDDEGSVTAQYQLDLIKIHKSTTASASKAKASSKAGRRVLKARVAADGPTGYRWNDAAGALERRSDRALRGTVADSTVALP